MNELACRNAADALCLGKVGDDVGEHDFFVVAVDAGGVGRIFAADKLKLLIYGLFILGFVKIALLIHLAKDVFLTFLIILNAVERVVVRRQIRYADNGSGFGNGKILCVLTEVGLCRRLHAVAALAEIHGVEVPFENLFLIVLLLEVQRLEYLQKLSLNGDIILLGEVLDKLLGYRRAAEGRAAGEHVKRRVRRSEPVNALMRVKALVLDGDERILHVLRNLIPVHPDAVFAAADGRQLLIISVCILVIDNAGLVEREIVKIQIEARRDAGLYIECKDAHKDKPRHDADEQDSSDYAQNTACLAAAFFGAGLLGNIHSGNTSLRVLCVKSLIVMRRVKCLIGAIS